MKYDVSLSEDKKSLVVTIPIDSLFESIVLPSTRPDKEKNLSLTAREHQVFEGMRTGQSNKEIACLLNVAERTVKFHVSKVFEKLGVGSRQQVAQLYGKAVSVA